MTIPKHVQDQMTEVDRIEQQIVAAQTPVAVADDNQPLAPVVDLAPKPDDPAPAPIDPVVLETPKNPEETVGHWQQKYRTLQGMYDAEVPRLHGQIRELSTQVTQLSEKLEATPATPATPVTPAPRVSTVSEDEVTHFGPELIAIQRKIAREEYEPLHEEIASLKAEAVKAGEEAKAVNSVREEANFQQQLAVLVPHFQTLNVDPNWVAWLNEVDPILRAPRITVANEAFYRGDAQAVAYYVGLYEASLPATDLGTTAPTATATDKEVDLQIQPPKNQNSSNPASQKGIIYKTSDIEKMFSKSINMSNHGDLQGAKALEAQIDAAYQEGRVRG